jgi:hypothetical protein
MLPKPHSDPGAVAKDALRGIRFALKRGAKMMMVNNGPRQLPEQFESASSNFLQNSEILTGTVDKIIQRILGLEFDPVMFAAPSFASTDVTKDAHEAMSTDASNLYFALSLSAKHLGVSDLLVSEAICAKLIAEDGSFDWPLAEQSTEFLCSQLCIRIINMNILGDPPGVSSSHNADRAMDVAIIAFATALWVYVERGKFSDTEPELLEMCCSVAEQKRNKITQNMAEEDRFLALFKYALETV